MLDSFANPIFAVPYFFIIPTGCPAVAFSIVLSRFGRNITRRRKEYVGRACPRPVTVNSSESVLINMVCLTRGSTFYSLKLTDSKRRIYANDFTRPNRRNVTKCPRETRRANISRVRESFIAARDVFFCIPPGMSEGGGGGPVFNFARGYYWRSRVDKTST